MSERRREHMFHWKPGDLLVPYASQSFWKRDREPEFS